MKNLHISLDGKIATLTLTKRKVVITHNSFTDTYYDDEGENIGQRTIEYQLNDDYCKELAVYEPMLMWAIKGLHGIQEKWETQKPLASP